MKFINLEIGFPGNLKKKIVRENIPDTKCQFSVSRDTNYQRHELSVIELSLNVNQPCVKHTSRRNDIHLFLVFLKSRR